MSTLADYCPGHESLRGDLMGASFHCNGTCLHGDDLAEALAEIDLGRGGPRPDDRRSRLRSAVMTIEEMRQAADEIGLTRNGRRVQLLAVYPERGSVRIIEGGFSVEVPVTELRWND